MREYLSLGSAPANEPCAQVGSENYRGRAAIECEIYKKQLVREFGPPPSRALLRTRWSEHDFGTYAELIVSFDPDDPPSSEYAQLLDASAPVDWDRISRNELDSISSRSDVELTFELRPERKPSPSPSP